MIYARVRGEQVIDVQNKTEHMFGVLNSHNMGEEELNAIGIYSVNEVYPEKTESQNYESDVVIYDAEQNKVFMHYIAVERPKQKEFSAYQFRELFTLEEKIALYQVSETDIILKIFREDLMTTDLVNLEYKSTLQGMQYLVQKGILTQERYDEIMGVA